jgi:hypothetical protein
VTRRLERVAELLGPDWQQPQRALDIQLALRLSGLRHLLGESRQQMTGDAPPAHDA